MTGSVLLSANADTSLSGSPGDDLLIVRDEGVIVSGGAGNDTYRLFQTPDQIIEYPDEGIDTVEAYRSFALPENVENLFYRGSGRWRILEGNDADNLITADQGNGEQAIAGYGGDDTLTGGNGADQFTYFGNDGHDVVTDFTPGEDVLALWETGGPNFATLMDTATQTDTGDLVLHLDEDSSITLVGIAPGELNPADVFIPSTTASNVPEGAVLVFASEFEPEDANWADGMWNTSPVNGHPAFSTQSFHNREHSYVDDVVWENADGTQEVWSPFSTSGGVLSISAIRTPEEVSEDYPEDWLSGELTTYGTFEQTYGYYEISARLPAGQGLWPAFWLSSADNSWPPEIDLIDVMGNETHILQSAVHGEIWGTRVMAAENWFVPDLSEEFHTYGMLWTPEEVTFFFDGIEVYSVETPPDMHDPMVLRLNLAMGGWNGPPDGTTPENAAFEIDYVRVYDLPGTEDLPRSEDVSDYANLETGEFTTNVSRVDELYTNPVTADSSAGFADLTIGNPGPGGVIPLPGSSLIGDAASNHLTGGDQDNTLNGRAGDDLLVGGAGNDRLIGDTGNDTLDGGVGNDTLIGGAGDDLYIIRAADGSERALQELVWEQPGQGSDTIHFADMTPDQLTGHIDWARWRLVLTAQDGAETHVAVKTVPGPDGNQLASYVEFISFADGTVWDLQDGLTLIGTDGDDQSSGTPADDHLMGGSGADTMAGMDGNDTLDGGDGVDIVYGWEGDDLLIDSGSEGGDQLYGEAGNDTLLGGDGMDWLYGGTGSDSLRSNDDADNLSGGDGADTLKGGDGADTILGDGGDDRLMGGQGNDGLFGGGDNDTIHGDGGDDTLAGGTGDDKLWGGDGADLLDGGAGRDVLRGGAGQDVFAFRLTEIENDLIMDHQAGERIEIHGITDETVVTVAGEVVTFVDGTTGESATLRVLGASERELEADILLLAG